MRKLILSVVFCWALLSAVTVSAAEIDLSVSVSNPAPSVGDRITVSVSMGPVGAKGVLGPGDLYLVLPSCLTYVEGSLKAAPGAQETLGVVNYLPMESPLGLAWYGFPSDAGYQGNSKFDLICFEAEVKAPAATAAINLHKANLFSRLKDAPAFTVNIIPAALQVSASLNPPLKSGYEVMQPAQPADTKTKAVTSQNSLILNGQETLLPAYNIENYNWLKLRDLAALMNQSAKQFSVAYDDATIAITAGKPYAPVGDELKMPNGTPTAVVSPQKLTVNGTSVAIAAYNINDYNYFRLRDIAILLNFKVIYDSATGGIQLDLQSPYSE